MKSFIVASIALLASASVAEPLLVVMKNTGPTRVVSFADLNLASEAGQGRLGGRIRAAARELCYEDNIEQLKFTIARRHCYSAAVDDAYDQMSAAIAQARAGRTIAAAMLTVSAR
jgi:UrcA family protein